MSLDIEELLIKVSQKGGIEDTVPGMDCSMQGTVNLGRFHFDFEASEETWSRWEICSKG